MYVIGILDEWKAPRHRNSSFWTFSTLEFNGVNILFQDINRQGDFYLTAKYIIIFLHINKKNKLY